ncbi:MAG: hypothetical protein II767_00055 [Proteobacteria bacterium]|nr:hypothetical protein [Pseudomonadota bacterium]
MIQEFDDSAVAKDIEAVCSKCGETWHVIVAVADGKIAQVQCKSCMGYHKYKPVAAARRAVKKSTKTIVADTTPDAPRSTKATSSRSASRSTKSSEPTLLVPKVAPNNREIRPYNIHETNYQLGDTIEHSKFGLGIVDELPAPNKMYVTFQTQRLLLIYGK